MCGEGQLRNISTIPEIQFLYFFRSIERKNILKNSWLYFIGKIKGLNSLS